MSWTLYILKCSDGTLYTGITTDLNRRLAEHGVGKGARYTKGRSPLQVVYQESHENRSEASKRELQVKSFSRADKMALIASCSNED